MADTEQSKQSETAPPAAKIGDTVRLPPPADMRVVDVRYDEFTGAKRLCCEWVDARGDKHHRWFPVDHVQLVKSA